MKRVDVRNGILIGLLFGLLGGLLGGLLDGLIYLGLLGGLLGGLISGLGAGLISGLTGGFLSGLLIGKPVGITLTDELVWSWRSLRRGLLAKRHMYTTLRVMALIGLLDGLISGLNVGLGYAGSGVLSWMLLQSWLHDGLRAGLRDGLRAGLGVGLSFWFLLGLFQGVSSETIEDHHRVVPNQGIRRSAHNSLVFGLISTAIVWSISGLSVGLISGPSVGLISGLSVGLSAGLLAGLLNGGLACLRHGVIRLLLWRSQAIPWNYPRFLDDAAERILLRKVGGGYIFVHRLLLEYFASLDTTPTPDAARAKRDWSSYPHG